MRSRRWPGVARGLVVALAAAVALLAAPGSALAQAQVAVFPSPGTTSALPQTQITFRGIPASQIGHITVVGSSSGAHSGAIDADSDGQGGSFVPSVPFTAGETVTVTTGLNVLGGTSGTFHFGIASPFGTINPMKLPMVPAGSNGVQHFHSQPNLLPASITVNRSSSSAYPGDIFVTPQYGPLQNGPMILNSSGKMIWFQPIPANELATDFRVQTLNGQPVLTWWQGYTNNGSGRGEGVIYNTQYQQIGTVQAGNGLQGMDLHEFLVTPQGDAYIVGVSPVHYAGMGRPLMDSVIQEIDIKTGLVLFEWHALDHIPITQSFFKKGAPGFVYDPYHLNSISIDSDGNLIVSMRNTWGVYKIDHNTGAVIWTLGTNQNNFKMGSGTQTAFQHDVLVQSGGMFTAFRRRWRAAHGPPGSSRRVGRQRDEQDRDAGEAVRAQSGARHQFRGQRPGASQQRPVCRLGAAALLHRVQLVRAGSVRRPLHLEHVELPCLQVALERPADDAAGDGAGSEQRRDDRAVVELERRHRRVIVAGARGHEREHAGAASDFALERLRDVDLGADRGG